MSKPTAKQVKNYYKKKPSRKRKSAPKKAPAAPAAKTTPPATEKKSFSKKAKAAAPPNVRILEASENLTSDQCQFPISRKKTPGEDDINNCELNCPDNRNLEVLKYKEFFQCNLKNTEITLNLNNIINNYEHTTKLCHYHIKEVLGLKIKKITSLDPTVSEGELQKRIISYEIVSTSSDTLEKEVAICGYSTIEGKPDIGNLIPLGNDTNNNVAVNSENIVIATRKIDYGEQLFLKKPNNYKKIEPLKKRLAISGPKGPFTNENSQAPVRVLSPKKV
jgi:hypothetical protein